MNNKAYLQLPPGSAGLFLEEAAGHQRAIDNTNRLFSRWGYTIVHTPMLDYFDAHSHMLNKLEKDRIYRLIGRDGEVLMLRSDITIFLLKHFQSLLKGAQLPLRLSYSDSIARHEDQLNISLNDHYQTGAELIGTNPAEEDLEILLLLCENLEILGIQNPAIHLGSRAIFNSIFADIAITEREPIQTAIIQRDWASLQSILEDRELPCSVNDIVDLFSVMHGDSTPDELSQIHKKFPAAIQKSISSQIAYIRELQENLGTYFPDIQLRIDLSEIGERHYYSGLVFYVYTDGLPYPVASGGRYDDLLRRMGLSSGAVGYSLMLGALKSLSAQDSAQATISMTDKQPEASLLERYEIARKLRKEGKSVCL